MNLNSGFNYTKKNGLNTNITKIVNLILSNQPIIISNLKYNNNYINKNRISNKGFSMKNNNLKKYKSSCVKDNNNFYKSESSKIKLQKKSNINISNICNKYKPNKRPNSLYIIKTQKVKENIKNNEIPNNNIYHKEKNDNRIANQKVQSNSKIQKIQKSKSFSTASNNLNHSTGSFDRPKILKRNISSGAKLSNIKGKINWIINDKNKRNNKYYLIKKRKNFSHDLKAKINIYIEHQRKYSQKDYQKEYANKNNNCYSCFIRNFLNKKNRILQLSKENHKKMGKNEKNNTFCNITYNSDKDNTNTNMSSKKNILTTNNSNCNNVHYCTTNFNNSTNMTESFNDLNNDKLSNRKKTMKKKINLPFHPNYKREDSNNNQFDNKKTLVRNNKSEINIPYNKNNKIKMKRDNSSQNLNPNNFKSIHNKQDIDINTSRESFIDLYKNKNVINSFNITHCKDKTFSITRNDFNESNECIEMNHFRIVSIIQENKKLLRKNDK